MGLLVVRLHLPPCMSLPLGAVYDRGYGLAARLTPEVSRSAMIITTSIPATGAPKPQPDVLGASHTLGTAVGIGVSCRDCVQGKAFRRARIP